MRDLREADILKEEKAPGSALYQVRNQGLTYDLGDKTPKLLYPVEEVQTTLVRLELVADRISWVRTVANGKIDFMELESRDEGNELVLKIVLINTDTIAAGFIFKIEDCDDGPIITPTTEMNISIDPVIPILQAFTIKANVQDDTETFKCNSVLYDSELNKLD